MRGMKQKGGWASAEAGDTVMMVVSLNPNPYNTIWRRRWWRWKTRLMMSSRGWEVKVEPQPQDDYPSGPHDVFVLK